MATDEKMIRDTGYAPDRWAFDSEVTRVFPNMLDRSVPQLDVMRAACLTIGRRFVATDTDVVDLGASRGDAVAPFVDAYGARVRSYHLVETSAPMVDQIRDRFGGMIADGPRDGDHGLVRVHHADLRTFYPPAHASLTLSVLTLMFVPIEHRQRVLDDVYRHTARGGAVVLVEKILGADGETNQMLVDAYYDMKRRNGYTQEEIDRKRLALEGVLVPLTAKGNEDLLASAGFRHVDVFWRWMNFAAWVAVRV